MRAVSAFIRGQGTVCFVLAVYYALTLTAAGLKYGLLVGLGTGLLSFVPFVGWALGLITATIIAIVQFWPDYLPILIVIGIFVGAQVLDAGFLSPNIVGSKIGLHPVWLIFSLFVFSYLFGFVGVLVAVPIAAAVGVLVRFALKALSRERRLPRRGARGRGAAPARDRPRHDRRSPPARPRPRAPPGAGRGGLLGEPLQRGRRRADRPLARLAAPGLRRRRPGGRGQEPPGQRLAPAVRGASSSRAAELDDAAVAALPERSAWWWRISTAASATRRRSFIS